MNLFLFAQLLTFLFTLGVGFLVISKRTRQIERLQQEQRQTVANISHGLQTPLTIAKGELEVLAKAMPKNKKLRACERTLDDISRFIYRLLALEKLECEKKEFSKKRVNISCILEELADYYAVVLDDKNMQLTRNIAEGVFVAGIPEELKELVTILVSNASKYMKESEKQEVVLTLKKEKGHACLEVKDTGPGIAPEDLPHIFKRFYCPASDKKTGAHGTGLGLAIAKAITEKHGGAITVKSNLGLGTTFTILLPYANASLTG